jgi:hypothetical protein
MEAAAWPAALPSKALFKKRLNKMATASTCLHNGFPLKVSLARLTA